MLFLCCPTLAHQWHPIVPAGLTHDASGQPFISGILVNGTLALPRPHGAPHRQILPHFCGKGPEQLLQDPMGSCHEGHLASADLSHYPHGSISLSHTTVNHPCHLNHAGNHTHLCTDSELEKDPNKTTKLKLHLEKNNLLMVQSCELIRDFTEDQCSGRTLLLSARAPGHPLSPALWVSCHHSNIGKNFFCRWRRWY